MYITDSERDWYERKAGESKRTRQERESDFEKAYQRRIEKIDGVPKKRP